MRKPPQFSLISGVLVTTLLGVLFAVVRLEYRIRALQEHSNSLASEQGLLVLLSRRGLAVRSLPDLGSLNYRIYCSSTTLLRCRYGSGQVVDLLTIPPGEHLISIQTANYGKSYPTSVRATRFTNGAEMDACTWTLPSNAVIFETRWRGGSPSTFSTHQIEICVMRSGLGEIQIVAESRY